MRERIPIIRLETDTGRLVARDGVVMCFFMRRSHTEVAPAIWRALQAYLRAAPPKALSWYGSDDGDTLPLDDKGWEYVRWKILERSGGIACIVDLEEDAEAVGGYHFEYHGRQLGHPDFPYSEDATTGVSFTFPTEYLLEHGPAHLRALALEIAQELPLSFGYASLAFVSPHGLWFAARKQLLAPLVRYPGLDIYRLNETSRVIGTRARGAYWLTFLGEPLLGQLGGLDTLKSKLPFPEVSFHPMEGDRLLLSLGEWPDAIDLSTQPHVPQYVCLARLLEPFLYEEDSSWFALFNPHDKENMRRWLRRLC